jgi:hypothetical protein
VNSGSYLQEWQLASLFPRRRNINCIADKTSPKWPITDGSSPSLRGKVEYPRWNRESTSARHKTENWTKPDKLHVLCLMSPRHLGTGPDPNGIYALRPTIAVGSGQILWRSCSCTQITEHFSQYLYGTHVVLTATKAVPNYKIFWFFLDTLLLVCI